jgi:hypothetical protein
VLIGGLWAWIAPAIHGVVAVDHTGERVHDYLGAESEHFFVAAFLMLGLLSVVSVVAPVLVWQWREHRGPGMVARGSRSVWWSPPRPRWRWGPRWCGCGTAWWILPEHR